METPSSRTSMIAFFAVLAAILGAAVFIEAPNSRPRMFDTTAAPPPAPVTPVSRNPMMDLPLDQLTEGLAKKLERNPDNISGWVLLGRSYATLGHPEKSAEAFAEALKRAPNDPEVRVTFGETLVTQAEGRVTPEAHKLFLEANKIDPAHPGARHFLALLQYQQGDHKGAHAAWQQLTREAPEGAPWLPRVQENLNQVSRELGLPIPEGTAPKAVESTSAPQSSEPGNAAFIQAMVDRLAAKMEKNPGDLEGWKKLGRSYSVLGDRTKALYAYGQALKLSPDDPELRKIYAELGGN